jgi:asparagine synthase (glutamine-hydrolysing)
MCGFAGFVDPSQSGSYDLAGVVTRMADTLRHRGPDDSGVWTDADTGVALGFRRLSIIDLSQCGHQPMVSPDGRYVLVYNGEVYNSDDLRADLLAAGCSFKGHSDTEVVLAAIATWGLRTALERFNGMFAFAVWDTQQRTLSLARDRIGIKPLYYGWNNGVFFFGSELKPLKRHPAFRGEIDRNVLALFFRHCYVPSPHCIYQDMHKLEPGVFLTLKTDHAPRHTARECYWSARETAERGLREPFRGSARDAEEHLDHLLRTSVHGRMRSDVPLGAMLSGGIDSSLVVALMQDLRTTPVQTFSIGFHEDRYNEAPYARAVADHLHTHHTELYVTPRDAMEVIPSLPTIYDEPFGDLSGIPTHLVSRLAREDVTVCLSGDGGDELFAGYNRYHYYRSIWRKMHLLPRWMSRAALRTLTAIPPRCLWPFSRPASFQKRIQRLKNALSTAMVDSLFTNDPEVLYHTLFCHWRDPANIVKGAEEPPTVYTDRSQWLQHRDILLKMMYTDQVSYLPDDILTKVDRASMHNSLEVRVPLVGDHRVVEFSWSLPRRLRTRGAAGKWLLRKLLYRHVPRNLVDRPKMGFGVPMEDWLRGPLRDWAEDLLSEHRLQQEGHLDPAPIRDCWDRHLEGQQDWHYHLWDILMFQAWLQEP